MTRVTAPNVAFALVFLGLSTAPLWVALKTSYLSAVPPGIAGTVQENVVLLLANASPSVSLGIAQVVASASLQSHGAAWLSESASVLLGSLMPGHLSALGSDPTETSGSRSPSKSGK